MGKHFKHYFSVICWGDRPTRSPLTWIVTIGLSVMLLIDTIKREASKYCEASKGTVVRCQHISQ